MSKMPRRDCSKTFPAVTGQQYDVPDDAVLVAQDLSPADLSMLEGDKFRGIVLATGGVTSHASILAKSFEIPSVVAVEDVMERVRQGDQLIIDGNAGSVHVNPSAEVIREYDRLKSDYAELNRELGELKDLPAETTDGHRVSLCANVGLLERRRLRPFPRRPGHRPLQNRNSVSCRTGISPAKKNNTLSISGSSKA